MSESRLGARRMYGAGKPCIRTFELFVPRRQGAFAKLRKLHHKVMVIDELIVVAGSFNYTEPANEKAPTGPGPWRLPAASRWARIPVTTEGARGGSQRGAIPAEK